MFSNRINFQETIRNTKGYIKSPSVWIHCHDAARHKENTPHTVYQFYDSLGDIIYVGLTKHLTNRLHQHKHNPWRHEIVEYTYKDFQLKSAAAATERLLVKELKPKYNITYIMFKGKEVREDTPEKVTKECTDIIEYKLVKFEATDTAREITYRYITDTSLQYLLNRKTITKWELNFYLNIQKYRVLSDRQLALYDLINQKMRNLHLPLVEQTIPLIADNY